VSIGSLLAKIFNMSAKLTKQLGCCASVAAALPALLLTATAPATHADPCAQWAFPIRSWGHLQQDNGWTLLLNFPGWQPEVNVGGGHPIDYGPITNFTGSDAIADSGRGLLGAKLDGSISGNDVHYRMYWANGTNGNYKGTIDPNGIAHGTTTDGAGNTAHWDAVEPLQCAKIATPPPPPPPKRTVKIGWPTAPIVDGDADVYNVADDPPGTGQYLDTLPEGTIVTVHGVPNCPPHTDTWCHISGPNVPNGDGWVFGHIG
jgi:hypothetical protein